MDLDLTLSLPGQFADVQATLQIYWPFSTETGLKGLPPVIHFRNVRLDFGTLLSSVILPIVNQVRKQLDPVADVIDDLNKRIPGLSDVAGKDVSLISLPDDIINGVLGSGGPISGHAYHVLDFVFQVGLCSWGSLASLLLTLPFCGAQFIHILELIKTVDDVLKQIKPEAGGRAYVSKSMLWIWAFAFP